MVRCCLEARLVEKKQDWVVSNRGWAVLNRFQGPLVQIGFGSLRLGWAAAFPPMCRAIPCGCPLLLLVNNRGGCWDFWRLGALDLAQNNFLPFPVCVALYKSPRN
ncbi:hypothetical protein SLEP1_g2967 [Rubroshorea leprosula]|uniref:Uncharacterized protein n=1 Tax=Rubroshorea leprosula TaxID=152421 RepID=A0AAV5HSJ6_9ROSI|nr:hypothetical protein SLEP1_g2967 [Rubroshorea leprosula]